MSSVVTMLVWLHFWSDFIMQSDQTAQNKSKDFGVLCKHGLVYGLPFLFFGWQFWLVNTVLHIFVDFFTSKLTSKLHAAGERREFFLVIGADQAVHLTCLILTYEHLVGF